MPATRDVHGRDAIAEFRERALRLGPAQNLVGILSRPEASGSERPAVVVLNAGVLHRVGPHRLHVRLTRRLAALGFAGLRLDLAGIGDSLAVAGTRSFRESAVADTQVAMDELTAQTGAARFVLVGLCSGADNALATAASDPRVAGLVILDPPSYRTTRARLRKAAHQVAQRGLRGALAWGLAVGRRELGERIAARRHRAAAPPSEGRETPPLAGYRQQLEALLARDVKILAIYSGGLGERYNHVDQLFEYAPALRGRLTHAYFPDANHLFTERAQQTELLDTIAVWVDRRFR